VDGRVLEAAAILHDFLPIEKSDPRRALASRLSADAAMPHLTHLGFSQSQRALAHHAIVAHSWSAGVQPLHDEAWILRDADRLDAMGAIGIARCLMLAGRLGQSLYHLTDPHAADRPLDDRTFAYDHFPAKLYSLCEGLHTQAAQEEGATRLASMRAFWTTLFSEIHPSF
jgi:uncharacterized protein